MEEKPKYDLEIHEDNKGNLHSQISAYVLLIAAITVVIVYYFMSA